MQNRLSREKSPYLLQHKDNPVWWQPWGDDAFEAARIQNKPIFLSIGYATCHWCHVMEHESFEDREVADLLNANYISIKVDREELPDVDQVYMRVVQGMSGHGGWPMTVLLTPERKPFFGGTYFPKTSFVQLLTQVSALWSEQRGELEQQAVKIVQHFSERSAPQLDNSLLDNNLLLRAAEIAKQEFDPEFGGFGGAPKFPPALRLQMLLRVYRRSGDAKLLEIVERTLKCMAYGGIYDHLGGGFSRYSVDEKWLVPHFEKMLYDNALLSSTYLETYLVTKHAFYLHVASETLDYVLREMSSEGGGFFSAEDADSEGVEGKFYVWSEAELKEHLSTDEFSLLTKFYPISAVGNFEHKNILALNDDISWERKYDSKAKALHQKLLAIRSKRIHPLKDDKILTSWNGLMIDSMALAYRVSGNRKYLEAAQKAASFIRSKLWQNGKLLRRYRDGDAQINGLLDDYVFLIKGLISLYQSDLNSEWIKWAIELQEIQDKEFLDRDEGGYWYSNADLIFRLKEFHDGAEPNPNSYAALNLLHLHGLTLESRYFDIAKKIVELNAVPLTKFASAFSSLLSTFDLLHRGLRQVVVAAPELKDPTPFYQTIWNTFCPDTLLVAAGESLAISRGKRAEKGEVTAYPCRYASCEAPIVEAEKLRSWVLRVEGLDKF